MTNTNNFSASHAAKQCMDCPAMASITTTSTDETLKAQIMDSIIKHEEHNMYITAEDIANEVNIALPSGNGWYALRKFGGNLSAGSSYLLNILVTSLCSHYRTFVLILQLTNYTNLSLRIAMVFADLFSPLRSCYFVSAQLGCEIKLRSNKATNFMWIVTASTDSTRFAPSWRAKNPLKNSSISALYGHLVKIFAALGVSPLVPTNPLWRLGLRPD